MTSTASSTGPPGRILVVDGDPAVRTRIDDALDGDGGPPVVTAETADAALTAVETAEIACVVAASELPDGSGLDLLSEVRTHDPALPFVLLDDERRPEVAQEAFDAGATDYVTKRALDSETDEDRTTVLAARIGRAVREYETERARRETDRRLSTLLDNLPGMAYRCLNAPSWPMEFVSDGCEELTGYENSQLEAGAVEWGDDVIHPEDREEVWAAVQSALEDRDPFEITYRIVRRDGSERWVWERGRGTYDGDELVALEGYINDITERREYESELAEKGSLLDSIFKSIPEHLYVKDDEGRHVRVSEAEVDPETFVGRTDPELAPEHADRAHAERAYEDDMHVVETGEAITDKEEYIETQDQWNLTSKVPWRDADGDVIGVIGLSWNITERKRAEQALRRQNDRLDQFASVVSHDLRNPLNVAEGYLELAREEGDDADALDRVEGALDRMNALIEDVLTLAREGEVVPEPEPVPLEAVAADAWESVETVGAELELDGDLGRVVCDRARVQRLFENLFRNSVEHGSTCSRSETGTAGVGDRDGLTIRVETLPDRAGFAVADDGSGIPERVRSRVFDPGYSGSEEGTGFGLPIVKAVATAHEWTVHLVDDETGGARFEFTGVDRTADAAGDPPTNGSEEQVTDDASTGGTDDGPAGAAGSGVADRSAGE